MSPLPQPLRASLCVASGFFAFQLLHTFFIGTGAAHGAAARHGRLDNTPSAAPTADRRAGALQPKGHDLPQRDHGRGLVLPDTRGAQSRGGRPRRARRVEFFRPRGLDGATSPRAGNAEAYYPHFQFDSNYMYGMVHRE